jgi:hypothetical protein
MNRAGGLRRDPAQSKEMRGLLCPEERAQLGVGLLWSLLGEVVAAVEHPTAHFLGPPPAFAPLPLRPGGPWS